MFSYLLSYREYYFVMPCSCNIDISFLVALATLQYFTIFPLSFPSFRIKIFITDRFREEYGVCCIACIQVHMIRDYPVECKAAGFVFALFSYNPFAMLTVVYLVSAGVSFLLFFVLNKGGNLIAEYSKLNWVPFVFGLVLVGLETGFVYAYKAGWQVNTASIVQSAFLAAVLIVVGALLFHEAITWNKIIGILICVVGLVFVNLK